MWNRLGESNAYDQEYAEVNSRHSNKSSRKTAVVVPYRHREYDAAHEIEKDFMVTDLDASLFRMKLKKAAGPGSSVIARCLGTTKQIINSEYGSLFLSYGKNQSEIRPLLHPKNQSLPDLW